MWKRSIFHLFFILEVYSGRGIIEILIEEFSRNMPKKNIHTVYNKERKIWETKLEGQKKPLASSRTKVNAQAKSIKEARKRKVEHIIHNMDGKISDSDSYGNDPFPPKDKRH